MVDEEPTGQTSFAQLTRQARQAARYARRPAKRCVATRDRGSSAISSLACCRKCAEACPVWQKV